MFRTAVTAQPCKYTQPIVKYQQKFFGWDMVMVSGVVLELPPGAVKYINENLIVEILKSKFHPARYALRQFICRKSTVRDTLTPGYYSIGKKFVRVSQPKPHTSTAWSEDVKGPLSDDARAIFGEGGILLKVKVGDIESTSAITSNVKLMDLKAFYRHMLTHQGLNCIHISGDPKPHKLLATTFIESSDVTVNCNVVIDGGEIFTKSEHVESVRYCD